MTSLKATALNHRILPFPCGSLCLCGAYCSRFTHGISSLVAGTSPKVLHVMEQFAFVEAEILAELQVRQWIRGPLPAALIDPRCGYFEELGDLLNRQQLILDLYLLVVWHGAFSGRFAGALQRSIGHCAHRRRASAAGASFLVVATLATGRLAGKWDFPLFCRAAF